VTTTCCFAQRAQASLPQERVQALAQQQVPERVLALAREQQAPVPE
jgi:hypothetical protein